MKTKHLILLAPLALLSPGCAYQEPIEYLPPGWTHPAMNETPDRARSVACLCVVTRDSKHSAPIGQALNTNIGNRPLATRSFSEYLRDID